MSNWKLPQEIDETYKTATGIDNVFVFKPKNPEFEKQRVRDISGISYRKFASSPDHLSGNNLVEGSIIVVGFKLPYENYNIYYKLLDTEIKFDLGMVTITEDGKSFVKTFSNMKFTTIGSGHSSDDITNEIQISFEAGDIDGLKELSSSEKTRILEC